MKVNFKIDPVLQKLKKMITLSGDMGPVLMKIRGVPRSTQGYTIIGGIQAQFISEGAFYGSAWQPLARSTQEYKATKYPGKTTLIRTGDLFNSLTTPGAKGNVEVLTWNKLSYGTVLPYAQFHMTGTKRMPSRKPVGISPQQTKVWNKLIAQYLTEVA